MITQTGKRVIAKYLIGQAPEFATHIVAGVGATVLYPGQTVSSSAYVPYEQLEFEGFRVPVVARGFIKEDGVEKLVIKAEMPSDRLYRISEIGFYTGASNPLTSSDSRLIAVFVPSESWTLAGSETPTVNEAIYDGSYNITTTLNSLYLVSDSELFLNSNRAARNEPPRVDNWALALSGSAGYINGVFSTASAAYWLENSQISFNLSQNLPEDEIRLAFSVISKVVGDSSNTARVRIVMDFINNLSGLDDTSPKARVTKEYVASDFVLTGTGELSDPICRYKVAKFTLSDFTVDDSFSWANVNMIRIYACAVTGGEVMDPNYYIAFDGLRFENLSTPNPIYGLCGYDVVQAASGLPITKEASANNYIEYRFGIGVNG